MSAVSALNSSEDQRWCPMPSASPQPRVLQRAGTSGLLPTAIVLFALERAAVVGHFEPKFMSDALLIPTFVLLGMTTPRRRLTTLIVSLHVIVVGCALFEEYFTQA